MAYRRRQSTKKSSGFKIQNEKMVYKNFMDDISNCVALSSFPSLKQDMITQTSETVYSYCYGFRQDSPFTKGLNYYCRDIGFAVSENLVTYKEYLPGVSKAYLMGEFNDFAKASHELNKVESEPSWFELEFESCKLSEGSRLILRVIDHQGTEYNMIPPSCAVTSGNYGIYLKYRKSPLAENPVRPKELLAFSVDVAKVQWENLLDYLKERQNVLERFTTIILNNVFGTNGLLHRYSIQQKYQDIFEEAIQFINIDLGCKVTLQWNFQATKHHYNKNPIEEAYSCKINEDKHQLAINHPEVFSFTLSSFSFFKNYFNIDGFYLNGVDWLASSNDGISFLKCLNLLQNRLSEQGITIASCKNKVPAICFGLLEGGVGFKYGLNSNEELDLFVGHQELLKVIQNTSPYSNCVSINLTEGHQESKMNIFLTYLACEKGVVCEGRVQKYEEIMRKLLKLRSQSEFFEESFKTLEVNEKRIAGERGRALIFFNFSEEETEFNHEGIEDAELIFNSETEQPVREKGSFIMKGNSCVLLEKNQ